MIELLTITITRVRFIVEASGIIIFLMYGNVFVFIHPTLYHDFN